MTPVLLALTVAVAAPAGKDAKADPPIVGEWLIESAIDGGKVDTVPPGTTWTFTADGKSVLALGGGAGQIQSTYTTDPKKAPAWLDVAEGPKGKPEKAIYKVDGDTLTICLDGKAGDRPTKFESPAGSAAVLVTLKPLKKTE